MNLQELQREINQLKFVLMHTSSVYSDENLCVYLDTTSYNLVKHNLMQDDSGCNNHSCSSELIIDNMKVFEVNTSKQHINVSRLFKD